MTMKELPSLDAVRFAPHTSVVAREVGEEMVLLDLNTGVYFSLNAVGTVVWQALERGATPAEACLALTDGYDVSLETARADVTAFLRQLVQAGLGETP
jgi:hypothetical protein